ncbi:MAG: hypothetical protein ABEI97_03830 [Candidatus Nanohaloarchaea archaeon]
MGTMADRGVIYYAVGEQYREEALRSAESVKEHMDIPITLFADAESAASVFDTVETIQPSAHPFLDRIQYLVQELVRIQIDEIRCDKPEQTSLLVPF